MITLINPNLVVQLSDPFTTGIVFMPIGLAYFAGSLRKHGFECTVLDTFGESPNSCRVEGGFLLRGLSPSELIKRIDQRSKAICIYASNITYHHSIIQIIRNVHLKYPDIPLILLENTQAVTAYSLKHLQEIYYDHGIDYIITGDAEERGVELFEALLNKKGRKDIIEIDGIGFRENGKTQYSSPSRKILNLDSIPFPAWDLFPLENYWKLKYAHGPFETSRYLPVMTSRGCPYNCNFCVIPETNNQKWRARSAANVVDELEEYSRIFGVTEFHLEDVNPTVSNSRTKEICEEIIRRDLKVTWKVASGTNIETLQDEDTIQLMARAGCQYISFSPESGSPRIMTMMNKRFDLESAERMVKIMKKTGISSQACFVIGYPGEDDEDRKMTRNVVHSLTRAGVDEIALFIVTPIPGSAIYDHINGYSDYSQLNFSPVWRNDYRVLNKFRFSLYKDFILLKLRYRPWSFLKHLLNFIGRSFRTKMEMTPYRALHTTLIRLKSG